MNIRTASPITVTAIAKVLFVIQLQINSERHIILLVLSITVMVLNYEYRPFPNDFQVPFLY